MTITEVAQESRLHEDPIDTVPVEALDFALVPSAGRDAEIDPNWLQLRGGALLPAIYMPPSMTGVHKSWTRVMAIGLVGMFLAATAAGVCLTYGAPYSHF